MAKGSNQKQLLDDIDSQLEEIRRRYDLYFQGSKEQRTPPQTAQAQLGGVLRRLREGDSTGWNTQDKFRLNQIHARYVSMERMWARGMQQVENGTSRRDKLKSKLREEAAAKRPAARAAHVDGDVGFDVDMSAGEDSGFGTPRPVAPVRPAAPPPVAGATPGSTPGGAPSDQRVQQIYQLYMQAKKTTGEVSTLTLDGLRAQLAKQMPVLQQKHAGKNIDFKVVLKDGKAMLKAVPK
jgi:hypothetical protein